MGSLVDISSSEMIGDFSGVALRRDSFIYSFVGQHFITYLLGARHGSSHGVSFQGGTFEGVERAEMTN